MLIKCLSSSKKSFSNDGFTVLEIVIAIVLAGLLIIPLSSLIYSLNSINASTEKLTTANAIIESKVEDLRNAAFLSLPTDTTVVDFESELPDSLAAPRSAQYTIVDLSSATKRVDLVLTFTEFGAIRSLTYSTIIGELGVGQY